LEIITGNCPFFLVDIRELRTTFKRDHAIPTKLALVAGRVDKHILKQMNHCWDYDPSKRPTASDICKFFRKLKLEDNHSPSNGVPHSRITSDNTTINYDFVLDILQRVSAYLHQFSLI
jgi:hypothetical protein